MVNGHEPIYQFSFSYSGIMEEEAAELIGVKHLSSNNGSTKLGSKTVSEQLMDAGRRSKVVEDEAEKKLNGKKMSYDERCEIEKDLKSRVKSILESSFPEQRTTLKTQIFEFVGTKNNPLLLESLRCLFWLLKTNMMDPDVAIIDQCLQVADLMPEFHVLLYVMKILNQLASYNSPELCRVRFGTNENYIVMGNILADKNGAARIAMALKNAVPSIIIEERINEFEFIVDQLNHWFIFVQRKILCPVAKKDVADLVEYFTNILLIQNTPFHVGLYVRNILVNLLNFQSNSDQADYVSVLVKELSEPMADLVKVRKNLEMLKKLAGRGRCGIIRRSENNAILDHLVRICLSIKEKDGEIVQICLHLIIMLYESPHYVKEHRILKTTEFVHFLTGAADEFDGDCIKILKFLIFNDPQNDVLKQSVLDISNENKSLRSNSLFNQVLEVAKGKTSFRHKCRKIQLLTYPTLVWFVLTYSKDTFLDLCIAINGIIFPTRLFALSWMLLAFAIFPLLVCNIASLKNFYTATPLSIYVSLEGYVPRFRLLKYIAPWRFDSKKHIIFNLLTIFQLHPAIMVVDILSHHAQPVGNILRSQYNLKKLGCIETMLENIPCLAIKVVKIARQFQSGRFVWASWGNLFEIITLVNSVFSLSKSALDFESIAKFVDNGRWQIGLFSQKAALLLGYLAMIGSRMLLFLILTSFDQWVYFFVLFLHVFLTFISHLFTYHIKAEKDGDLDEHFVFLRKFDWRLIPFALSEGFLVLLRSPMEYLGVYSHYQYLRKRWQFFSIYFIHWIEVVAVNLCYIFQKLAKDPENFVRYRSMFIISLLSIGLYFTSGLLFTFYFFICCPKKKETFKFVPENKRRVLYDDKKEHDFDWRNKACLKTEEIHEINGRKIPKLEIKAQNSSSSLRGDNPDFAKEYKAHLDQEECAFRADTDFVEPPPKKKPLFKIKSVYVKI